MHFVEIKINNMKTNKIALIIFVAGAMFTASSCSVEYRARHPRPKPKRVIVVGKTETEKQLNNNSQEQQSTNIAAY